MGTFTDTEKTDIRRFCGFGMYGDTADPGVGYRFWQNYGTLEFRMDRMLPEEEAVCRKYLVTLNTLEDAIPLAADNLDTDSAAIWTHNKNEVRDRIQLLDIWRVKLCDLLNIPPGPRLGGGGGGSIRLVV